MKNKMFKKRLKKLYCSRFQTAHHQQEIKVHARAVYLFKVKSYPNIPDGIRTQNS